MDRQEKIDMAAKAIQINGIIHGADGFKEVAEAALLAAGAIEPLTKKSRGAGVAEDLVTIHPNFGQLWFRSIGMMNGGQVVGDNRAVELLAVVRQFIAERIDAERAAARDEGLEEAAIRMAERAYPGMAAIIRSLKSNGGAK